ncbi:MAG: TolC family protein [Candidatus Fervidibacter sp.]|uniref:TolC family protein n=1 Tax=Candidatus Fervidibacter sp. TaxID=3100871 RepID=UPI00404B6FB3
MRWLVVVTLTGLAALIAPAQTPTEFDLQKVLQTALERHPSLVAAQSRVAAARAQWRQAKAVFLPRVDLTASYTQLHRDPSFTVAGMGTIVFGEKDNPQISWVVKLPLYTGGKLEGIVRQAKGGVTASEHLLERQCQKVALDATIAYFHVLKARGFVKVMEERLKALQSQRDDIAKMLERGVATRIDLLRSETAVAAAQEELTKARNGESIALAALANAMGLSPTLPVQVVASASIENAGLPNLPTDLNRAIEEAFHQRPEMRALEAQLFSAREGVRVAKSEQRPQVGVLFQYDAQRQTTMPDMGRWLVGVMASLNLFDGGATKATVEQALEQVHQLEAALAELRNGIALEVTNAFLNLESAKQRVKTAEKAVTTAEEGVRLVRLGYQNGVNTITDFLTAQAELTQAQISLVVALSDLRVAEAQLWFALGRSPEGLFEKRLQQ